MITNTLLKQKVHKTALAPMQYQGRRDGGGVYRYIYPSPPKKKEEKYQSTLKKFMWLFSCDPGQIRYMFTCGILTYVLKLQ